MTDPESTTPPKRGRGWLDLERTFAVVSESGDVDDRGATLFGPGPGVEHWGTLLTRRCVVVVGERGTGKTEELRAQADRLQRQGKHGFFLPVEDIATGTVESALDPDGLSRLADWRASPEPAWFFLDSVDESKLKGQKLATALRNFENSLQNDLGRVHVIISSRMSDWRSEDEAEVLRLEGYLTRNDANQASTPARAHVVTLMPLDRRQVAALAHHCGIARVDGFLAALRDANAWTFVERPLDVQWITAYWNKKGELGTLSALMHFNINERLREKESRHAPLSLSEARAGVSALALIALLSQKALFRLPDETPDARTTDTIDPREGLPGWTDDQIRDLLGRGLFDEATYGRVRIHHRSVQEYLAAEHFATLRTAGLPQTELEAILFRTSAGKRLVPKHLTAVLAWLSARDGTIRRKAIEIAPEHLIDEADPSALPAPERAATLRSYAAKFGDRERVYFRFDFFGLQRFACPELTDTIRELLGGPEPEHLKSMLLDVVERGHIAGAVDAAITLATAHSTSSSLRADAVRAVCKAGTLEQQASVAALANTAYGHDPDVAFELLDSLFPSHLDVSHVLALILALPTPDEHHHTRLEGFLSYVTVRYSEPSGGFRRRLEQGSVVRHAAPQDATTVGGDRLRVR